MIRERAFWLALATSLGAAAWSHPGLWTWPAFAVYGWILSRRFELFRKMSIVDSLTGVYSHAFLLETLRIELSSARRHRSPLSIAMLDIDNFKRINDQNGHPVGDRILRRMCEIIWPKLRAGEVLCRYGGDEFAIVMPNTPLERAEAAAERLRRLIEEKMRDPEVTISIGVAQAWAESRDDSAVLIRRADARLYDAKRAGRNRTAL
jgi:diguanylate cyclase (GGDEF)-like protein